MLLKDFHASRFATMERGEDDLKEWGSPTLAILKRITATSSDREPQLSRAVGFTWNNTEDKLN